MIFKFPASAGSFSRSRLTRSSQAEEWEKLITNFFYCMISIVLKHSFPFSSFILQKQGLLINWNLKQGEFITVHKIVCWFRFGLSLGKPDCWPPRKTACIGGKLEKACYKLHGLRTKGWMSDFFMCLTWFCREFTLKECIQSAVSIARNRPIPQITFLIVAWKGTFYFHQSVKLIISITVKHLIMEVLFSA